MRIVDAAMAAHALGTNGCTPGSMKSQTTAVRLRCNRCWAGEAEHRSATRIGKRPMCDYSLHGVASRPARLGEVLTTTAFNTWTRGFASLQDANTAVCVMPGTELAFERDILSDRPFWFWRKPAGKLVRFRQVNPNDPRVHHDAIEFPDGRIVLLTRLRPGQRATVIQLPAQRHPTAPGRPVEVTADPLVTSAPE
jgi:hypothetical protein